MIFSAENIGRTKIKLSNTSRMSTNNIYVIDLVEERERICIENSNNQNHYLTSRDAFNQINRPVTNSIIDFISKSSLYLEGLLGIAIIVAGSLLTLSFTCWPQHNVILNPDYWYEPMMSFNVVKPCLCLLLLPLKKQKFF